MRSVSVTFVTVCSQITVGFVAFRNERCGVDSLSAESFNSRKTVLIVFWSAPKLIRSSGSVFCCHKGC